MEDTVEISGEGAAKAAANESEKVSDVNSEDDVRDSGESASSNAGVSNEGVIDDASLKAELKETKDRLLRQVAEFQNYRRRTEQEKNNLIRIGKEQVVQQMLEIFDDFTRSMEATKKAEEVDEESGGAYQKLKEGLELMYDKFRNELNRLGVEPIDALGKSFNENEHEALMQQPAADDIEPGTVIEEIQKGYRMGDKVLRHSRVIVAS